MTRPRARAVLPAIAVTLAMLTGTMCGQAAGEEPGQVSPATPTVRIGPTAERYADGAALITHLQISCDPGVYGNVRLIARHDGRRKVGSGFADVACLGGLLDVPVAVVGARAFGLEDVRLKAQVSTCAEPSECRVTSRRVVEVVDATEEKRSHEGDGLAYRLLKDASLEGDSAVVLLPHTCDPDLFGRFDVVVAQASSGGRNVFAADDVDPVCDGQEHAPEVAVSSDQGAWHKGRAFLVVLGQICVDHSTCRFGVAYREIRLVGA